MQPARQQISSFPVSGITVCTTNHAESDPKTNRLGAHWGRFFGEGLAEKVPHRLAQAPLYGVYSAYESDYTGAFDVTAGVGVSAPSAGPEFSTVQVQAGEYLVFAGKGVMPQAVIDTWGTIWQFFQAHPEIRRSYRTDFEAYSGADEVAIHIGIEGS
ncbi:MAG TPA: GyrI-like domain-containing protein [Burkholderiaceae bacterium]|nr:GyrI-like domain-containing protein [Burkholderiaceae bacterium]